MSIDKKYLIAFLWVAFAFFLIMGVWLYLGAENVATLPADVRGGNAWPWPIGPLAMRFMAAFGISGALDTFLLLRRPDRQTMFAFGVGIAFVTGFQLLHLAVNVAAIDWSRPLIYVWGGFNLLTFFFCLLLIAQYRLGTVRTAPPLPANPPLGRWIAVSVGALTLITGAVMFLFPEWSRPRWPWDLINATNVQLLAAFFLATAGVTLWVWRQPSAYGYDILYPGAGVASGGVFIASLIHWNLFADHPLGSILFMIVYGVGAIGAFLPVWRYGLKSVEGA